MEKDNVLASFSLEGKVALVTGATYGIGFGIATALAQAGAKIAFNARKPEQIDHAVAEYAKLGIEAHGYQCDVTDEASVRRHHQAHSHDPDERPGLPPGGGH